MTGTFEKRFRRVEGDAMDLALKLVGDGFQIIPGTSWDTSGKTPRVRTLGRGVEGSMSKPLSGLAAMDAVLNLRLGTHQLIDSGYYLALGPVGDDASHVLVCLDVDNAHGDGQTPVDFDELVDMLAAWLDTLGCPEALDTLVMTTPGHGLHLLFWCEAALGWTWQDGLHVDMLPDVVSLDWHPAPGKQHETGPGSRRPRTRTSAGGEYRLFVPKTTEGDSIAGAVRQIPDALLRVLVEKSIDKAKGDVRKLFAKADDAPVDFHIKRAMKFDAIADIIREATKPKKKADRPAASVQAASCDEVGLYRHEDVAGQGTRHDALVRFAGTCVHRCTGRDFDDTCRLIADEIAAFAERRCSPPMAAADTEVRDIIHDAMGWAEDARAEIEGRIRSRVVVVDQSGERSVQVVRDYAEREVNGARYRCKIRKGGQPGLPVCSPANVIEALEHDHGLSGCFAFDDMSKQPVVVKPLPWSDDDEEFPRPVSDFDRSECICYLDEIAGWDSSRSFQVGFDKACNRHKFDPLREFVRGLDGEWDGQSHIDHLVADWMGVGEDDVIDGHSFSGEVMRVWMRGAIRRALHPGAKLDLCVILQGPQGCGKSTFWAKLAMRDDLLCESLTDVRDEARCWEQLTGRWIVVIDELAGLNRASDVARVKTFLTACKDERRMPYAKMPTVRPRRAAFCGTTNDLSFLSDRTGNRRFVVIPTTGVWDARGVPRLVDDPRFEAEVRQCWAEAYAIEAQHSHETLMLPRWCQAEQQERNAGASVNDPWTEPIRRRLAWSAQFRPDEPISFAQLYAEIQGCPQADYRSKHRHLKSFQDEARRVAESLGWSYRRAFGTFGDEAGVKSQQWALVPPPLTPDERVALAEAAERRRLKFEADEALWTGDETSTLL